MKNWIYTIMIGLMGSLISSCQQLLDDEIQVLKDSSRAANISMRLVLDEEFSASRSTWGNNEDQSNEWGTSFENEIDLTNPDALQVLVQVYNKENTNIAELEVMDKTIIRLDTENGRVYTLDGILDLEEVGIESGSYACKVTVYANCETDKKEFVYTADAFIPMWGVRMSTLNLAYEAENEIDDIYLLRAMAKVEVALHEDIASLFNLNSVVVDKYNTHGNVLPTGYATAVDTRNLGQQDVFNPKNSPSNADLSFTEVENQEVFFVYLPEYQNVDVDSPAEIHLVIDEKSYIIQFKHYIGGQATGESYNIVRNQYYKYTITSVSEETIEVNLTLKYKVEDWTEVTNPGFDFN